jgi:hypothetical protein
MASPVRCETTRDRAPALADSWLTQSELRRAQASEISLDERTRAALVWDEEGLRRALQLSLKRMQLVPLDLMRAWDKGSDGALSAKVPPHHVPNAVTPPSRAHRSVLPSPTNSSHRHRMRGLQLPPSRANSS